MFIRFDVIDERDRRRLHDSKDRACITSRGKNSPSDHRVTQSPATPPLNTPLEIDEYVCYVFIDFTKAFDITIFY